MVFEASVDVWGEDELFQRLGTLFGTAFDVTEPFVSKGLFLDLKVGDEERMEGDPETTDASYSSATAAGKGQYTRVDKHREWLMSSPKARSSASSK